MHVPVLLRIRNLKTYFYTYEGVVKALDGVDLDLYKGETLGLVGETGCGKSLTMLSVIRLIGSSGKIVDGEIWFKGENLLQKSEKEMKEIRGKQISVIFQDPMTYLNPVYTIGEQIGDVIKRHQKLGRASMELKIKKLEEELNDENLSPSKIQRLKAEVEKLRGLKSNLPRPSRKDIKKIAIGKTIEMLAKMRMPDPEKVVNKYPHELSGGMRQRALIAMALSCNPDLLIADEATTFLDVTVQAQTLRLLKEIKRTEKMSLIIVTHDLGVIAENCEKVAVMYLGNIVEYGDTTAIFDEPRHPYTQGLLRAIPKLGQNVERLEVIPHFIPSLINAPSGCRFHPRCKYAKEICRKEKPRKIEIASGHTVNCHLYNIDRDKN